MQANCSNRAPMLASVLILFLCVEVGAAAAATPTVCALPMRATVNGKRIQPSANCMKAFGRSDLPTADEVDRLYEDLMGKSILAERAPR